MNTYFQQYTFIALLSGVAVVLGVAPLILAKFVAPKKPGHSKQAPYECGIASTGDPWVRFRVQYYIYALLFVIFDVEAVFLYPWAVLFKEFVRSGQGPFLFIEMVLFLGVLAVGLVYIYGRRALEWD